MSVWFKNEMDHLGAQLTQAIEKGSLELQGIIKEAAEQINQQRHLTAHDLKSLVEFATDRMDEKVKQHLDHLPAQLNPFINQISSQLDEKLNQSLNRLESMMWKFLAGLLGIVLIGVGVGWWLK